MRKLIIPVFLISALSFFSCGGGGEVDVANTLTESLNDPVGLDVAAPRFSWNIVSDLNDVRQTGYHLLVASSEENLTKGVGDLWDSGVVDSEESLYIPYSGEALSSREKCYWKVQVRTNRGTTEWSRVNTWTMGLLSDADWQATWIGLDNNTEDKLVNFSEIPARYLRKDFNVEGKEVANATLYISGLGLYEAFINEDRIGDQQLAPTPTDYNKSVKYNVFDVTDKVKSGNNAIGVTLGNGRFVAMRYPSSMDFIKLGIPPLSHYGLPKLLLQLEVAYTDGTTQTVVSDASWKITANGPIRSNNEFDGEVYDANKELTGWNATGYDDSAWSAVEMVAAPAGKLTAQLNPNIKVMDKVTPVAINETKPDTYVLDMGQNMVGWLQIKAKVKGGDKISMRFAELTNEDGSIYTANLRSAKSTDTYMAKADGEIVWHPVFVYHGFRFVEITGLSEKPALSDFEGQVLYDEMDNIGSFETSDTMINKIYSNSFWGIRGNYRGMPTDCPQRDERMGWFGDRSTGCYGESFAFDNHLLYAKWLDDVENAQGENGDLPDIAPCYWPVRSDNMTWCGAYLMVADMLYEHFGDVAPVVKHYPSMKKWMVYMKDKYMVDGILTKDTYGDWCMPPESPELIHSKDPSRITDAGLLSTAFYYYLSGMMSKFAKLSGNDSDIAYFDSEAEASKKAFNDKYFNAEGGYYGNNTVTANILPLRFGMVTDENKQRVFDNIVEKTNVDFAGHVSTGVIGIQQLMRGLTDYGRGDMAMKIVTNTDYPSWGYMAENGATTIWELWNGNTANPAMNSANHVMLLGDLLVWEYDYLAGIANAPGSAGFKTVRMRPYILDGLNNVTATHRSPYGTIASTWKKDGAMLDWQINIPCNSSAEVCVPYSGDDIDNATRASVEKLGGKYVESKNGFATFAFPSGKYHLTVPVE